MLLNTSAQELKAFSCKLTMNIKLNVGINAYDVHRMQD